jgi:signal transduction histidine kinase
VWGGRPRAVWALSFGIWTLIALAASVSVYVLWLSRGYPMTFASVLYSEFSQTLAYAPLTPFVLALAMRFPIQKRNWVRRSLLHLLFAVAFSIAHVVLRGLSPYAAWDAKAGRFVSIFWNSQVQIFEIKWLMFKNLILLNLVDDTTGAYVPIMLVAHALSYYQSLRDREVHSAKLEMQLAKSHLESLKSHLQPHFLFNTMHSISALMLTDVRAADRMMARLSDLLRMSLESSGIQMTCLSRELEFLAGYLEIEKIRFEERLTVLLEIAPETLDARVPSLLLQPLVENAVRHGIARLSSGGTIWITSSHDGRSLCLKIRDNGPGLDVGGGVPSRTGVGLRTTRERLQTLYDNDQTMTILNVSDAGTGVEVCVTIPFRAELQLETDDTSNDESAM